MNFSVFALKILFDVVNGLRKVVDLTVFLNNSFPMARLIVLLDH